MLAPQSSGVSRPDPQAFGLCKPAYRVLEAADLLSLSRTKLYELVKSQQLKATKCGRRTLFLAVDIADFLSRLQNGEVG
ncbi:helix-turn-helix domain-containing protein [Azospirillum argentinense]|uniref:Helix-turn-helix domain-containing protein n=1 Tax=Azospirillum argentinense TaxID=2970906 RepID=A0A5B0KP81_9PROT|nr:helix-turn-helix domain-containing protein [Azospirillum argentinense]KAA1054442.1 hypothetical protein FH063_006698 [Azospirillum argentinense]